VRIVRVGQMMNLRGRHQLVSSFEVELYDGRVEVVTTTEETLQQLIRLASGLSATEDELKEESVEPEEPTELPDSVFGGDVDPGEIVGSLMGEVADDEVDLETALRDHAAGVMEVVAERAPVRPPARPRGHVDADGFFRPPPARTVEKDEMGYPIVAGSRATPVTVEEDDGDQI